MFESFDFLRRWRGDAPGRLERRLHRRTVDYWREARGDAALLSLDRFDPAAVEDRLDQGFLVDLTGPEPRLARIAPVLQDEAGLDGETAALAEVPAESLLARFAAHHSRAVDTGEPVTAEYDFVTAAGWHVLCRGALLPLSAGGERVDHVYGVISWKSEKVAGAQ